ncbi:leucine--tRNA ligase [bacterium (Candidatus Gribaldobacteria) CG_4_10_14_0_8_um_filter_33_9]|uniref:Leucine--tRNA ligase n=1 Tax=bacterium (Candidatus Gribaldobacteria) CG_4_10_14_0_8_um_filter_33_9 TaxID=2014266 RepID=A0A2M7RNS7_9BACT|nr:MAG: leucine--tRNA ligase [bacterium (Candidatus Gribaldobacteria) CG_4_10_14_0_8_um_filter_33_9]
MYNHKQIEKKWQKIWEEHPELYRADDKSKSEKKYILDMFPYPSGDGLHTGHVESYTATDIISRYSRMKGFNVLHPQGWDAFGLPAENYAIKTKIHPAITTKKAIANFKEQMKMMGFSYDWPREVNSSDSDYYKWTQWFFLLLYKNGLAYKKKGKVNWCDSCKTVLANEQAENGICERCKNPVEQKDLEQWFFKITDFIEDNEQTSGLLSGLDKVDWPESTKMAQRNWIGKSEGTTIKFSIFNFQFSNKFKNSNVQNYIEVFTTRVDTIFGCTYVVVAPEYKLIQELKDQVKNWLEVENYIEKAKKKTDLQRMETKEKTGVKLEGIEAVNPFNNETIPVFVADYVLGHYGTGAVMAVPAHDERDYEFAKKYDLPVKEAVAPYLKDNPRQDKNTEKRNVVTAIVKNPKNNNYLCLDWKTTEWKSFPAGGIEKDDLITAAKREIEEETGYKNIKFIKQIGDSVFAEFYRPHKDSNVYAHFKYLLFELENEEMAEVSQKEKNQHEVVWIEENKVDFFINVWNQKLIWKKYRQGGFAYCEDGILINSAEYNGLTSEQARQQLIEWLEKEKIGQKKTNYKLRDWLVSRQRYWGAPIPIIYCDVCGEVPVSEKNLPVELPTDVDFMPTGESPLVNSKKFQNVKCPKCGLSAKREADTMDTFVCSSWYYLRYSDPKNKKEFASKKKLEKWLPVDLYVGGAEHTVLHLLYARFFTKVLHNLGYIDFDEPFIKLRHQGIILAEDGRKMSKSFGNVVNPDDVVKQYGADALRLFEMFMGPLEDAKQWNTKGIIGVVRFLERVYKLISRISHESKINKLESNGNELNILLHKTIKKVGKDIEALKFNTAISALMILLNEMEKQPCKPQTANCKFFLKLLAPFAPYLAEELWSQLGNKESIFKQSWPEYDSELIREKKVILVVQINGKVRDKIEVDADISEKEAKEVILFQKKIQEWLQKKEIKKMVFVPGKLINIVIK